MGFKSNNHNLEREFLRDYGWARCIPSQDTSADLSCGQSAKSPYLCSDAPCLFKHFQLACSRLNGSYKSFSHAIEANTQIARDKLLIHSQVYYACTSTAITIANNLSHSWNVLLLEEMKSN